MCRHTKVSSELLDLLKSVHFPRQEALWAQPLPDLLPVPSLR